MIKETDEGEETADDPGSSSQEVQVHGAVQSTHQGVAPGSLPTGAEALQHGKWRISVLTVIVMTGILCCERVNSWLVCEI